MSQIHVSLSCLVAYFEKSTFGERHISEMTLANACFRFLRSHELAVTCRARQRLKTDSICLNACKLYSGKYWMLYKCILRIAPKCQELPWSWIVNRNLQRIEQFPVSTPYAIQKVHILNNCGGNGDCAVWKPVLFKSGSVPKEGTDPALMHLVKCARKRPFSKNVDSSTWSFRLSLKVCFHLVG